MPREPVSDRTSVARTVGGIRLRSPDGSEATITAWMASDILHDQAVREQLRQVLWASPVPFRIVETNGATGE